MKAVAPAESNSAAWSATIASGSLVAHLVAGKATRDALFLTHFGLTSLPAAMIAAALLSALSVVGMSRLLTRAGPGRVVPAAFALSAVLHVVEWSISLQSQRAAAIALYAHTAVFGAAVGSAFWSLVNERFDPHEAKRLVSRITGGGTIGGVIAGLLVWRMSAHLSVAMMLALLAATSVVGLFGSLRAAPAKKQTRRTAEAAPGGLRLVTQTPYLQDLAVLVGAGAIVQAFLDWLLSAHATQRELGQVAGLLGFFALFNVIVGVITFVVQMAITRLVLEKQGLGGTVRLQPTMVAIGLAAALAVPTFGPVLILRIIEAVTRGSFYRSAYELFYTPLPNAKKRATKTLIDVGVDRIGTALGSGFLLVVARLSTLELQTRVALLGVLVMTLVAWVVSSRLQEGYVAALASSLKSGALSATDVPVDDLTTKTTLADTTAMLDRQKLLGEINELQRAKALSSEQLGVVAGPDDGLLARAAALRSGSPSAMKQALVAPLPPELAPFVVPLLADDRVVRDALRALRRAAPSITGLLVDHLLDRGLDVRVRRRIPRILKVCRSDRAASGLLLALRDPSFEVRVQTAVALGHLSANGKVRLDREAVYDAAHHEVTEGRASWEPERGLGHVFVIVGLAFERELIAIAYRALRSDDPGIRGTAVEYLETVLPERLRSLIVPLLGEVTAPARTGERKVEELAAALLRSRGGLLRSQR